MWSNVPNTYILREIRSNRKKTFITVSVLGCVIIAFFFSYAAFGKEEKPKSSLLSVHILFRHGDRTPTFFYPTDPHKNENWPDGAGALTNKGKYQMYMLGKLIRSHYSDFLPDLYSNKKLIVKSSFAPRCQMSAAVLLAGLYPPVGIQIWNEELLWQPIPVNPIPRDRDNLIAAKATCPAFTEAKKESDNDIMNELTSEQRNLLKYLSNNTGIRINDISTAESLYYTLTIEKENELYLPSWTEKIYPEPLRTLAFLNLASFTRTNQLKRLQSGPLLGEWLSNLESSEKEDSPYLYLYSGHDLTIINMMRTLGLMLDLGWLPEYSASLLQEFHKKILPNETPFYFIKFLYLNSSSLEKADELKLPNCEIECPLEKFKTLIKPFIPQDWNRECNN